MIVDALLAQAAAADSAALAAAAGAAEEALACHRDALAALTEGWRGQTGCTATDSMHRQCADAVDIVAALHRAARELTNLQDRQGGDAGADSQPAEQPHEKYRPMTATCPPPEAIGPGVTAGQSGDTSALTSESSPASPVAVPADLGAAAPWATAPTTSAGPWAVAPTGAPQAPPNWPPGGSTPALPDLGGTLVSLVAQIAQALGSYSDVPGAATVEGIVDNPAHPAATELRAPRESPPPPLTPGDDPASPPDSDLPKSAVPLPLSPSVTPVPSPELLAAERPPDLGAPSEPAPLAVTGAVPEVTPPPPAAVAEEPLSATPIIPAPSPETQTPCEIAADELPKVGE